MSTLAAVLLCSVPALEAATIYVAAGDNLQEALDSAQPGDTILLAENAEFVGNFVLPVKIGDAWIVVRSASPDTVLPPAGVRIRPGHAPLLARLRSPNTDAALRTAPGAHHWDLRYLEFPANQTGSGDIIQLGDGSSAQNTLAKVPHHLALSHLYVHGDPSIGQKRGIALNAAHVSITDSHIADCKGVGQDTQAIGGWNGPGPYTIENNYLEAAGENVMFGGADPSIANLVADGITFRRNYLSRPMAWRNPIVGTPQGVTAATVTGGSLPAGTYAYRVVARRSVAQGTMVRSAASIEIPVTSTAAASGVRVRWQAVAGASEYRVYGRLPGAESLYWVVTTTEFVDTGATGTSEAVPTSGGTLWSVKNIFELKNARNVVIEGNIFENHWKESQPGFAIVLTPRNSNGACTWCVVENVRFDYNVVRNVAAGVNLLGYDTASRPTRQTANITFSNNLFTGLSTALGGNGWFLQIGEAPRDITISHNTIDSNGNAVSYTYGGTAADPREIYGFEMTANAARHAAYGFNGQFFPYGIPILDNFYPAWVFSSNYLAGAPPSRYPPGTLTAGVFTDQFVDQANGDYAIRAGSILKGGAADGSDVGADFATLVSRIEGVESGNGPGGGITPVPPTAALTLTCSYLECAFADASVAGSREITGWVWSFGDGARDTVRSGSHAFAAGGTYVVTVTVVDGNGLTASASKTVTVEPPNVAPRAAFTPACLDLTCTFTDASTDPDGTVVAWRWAFGTGTATGRTASVTFAQLGIYTVALTATDDDGATSTVSMPVAVTGLLHSGFSGSTVKWASKSGLTQYWSADVTVGVHGAGERPVAGAAVTAVWSGAVVKTVTCVTGADGRCTFKSGTLSYLRSWVSLSVTSVVVTDSVYNPSANHDQAGPVSAFRLIRP